MTTLKKSKSIPEEIIPGHIQAKSLIQMGFTPGLIWHFLGTPHISMTTVPFPKQLNKHYYREDAVRQLISSKRFQLSKLIETLRSLKIYRGHQGELDTITTWAERVPITTDFPDKTLDEIIQDAVQDRGTWQDFSKTPYHPDTAPPEILQTWAYTYLKHSCTNYDDLCRQLKSHPFSSYAYPTILQRVNTLILGRYHLDIQTRGNKGTSIRTCRKCGARAQGEFNGFYWTKPSHWVSRARNNSGNTINDFCSLKCAGRKTHGFIPRTLPAQNPAGPNPITCPSQKHPEEKTWNQAASPQ